MHAADDTCNADDLITAAIDFVGFHKDCVFVTNLAGALAAEDVVALPEDLV